MAKEPVPAAATATATEQTPERPGEDQVECIATGTFFRDEAFQGPLLQHGEKFSTHKSRAVELRGNGLVKYVDEAAEKEAAADDPMQSTDNGEVVITSRSLRRSKT